MIGVVRTQPSGTHKGIMHYVSSSPTLADWRWSFRGGGWTVQGGSFPLCITYFPIAVTL